MNCELVLNQTNHLFVYSVIILNHDLLYRFRKTNLRIKRNPLVQPCSYYSQSHWSSKPARALNVIQVSLLAARHFNQSTKRNRRPMPSLDGSYRLAQFSLFAFARSIKLCAYSGSWVDIVMDVRRAIILQYQASSLSVAAIFVVMNDSSPLIILFLPAANFLVQRNSFAVLWDRIVGSKVGTMETA